MSDEIQAISQGNYQNFLVNRYVTKNLLYFVNYIRGIA